METTRSRGWSVLSDSLGEGSVTVASSDRFHDVSVRLFVCPSVSVCPSICPSVCLHDIPAFLSFCLSFVFFPPFSSIFFPWLILCLPVVFYYLSCFHLLFISSFPFPPLFSLFFILVAFFSLFFMIFATVTLGASAPLYVSKRTCAVQTGEPFDIRCHREKRGLQHENW